MSRSKSRSSSRPRSHSSSRPLSPVVPQDARRQPFSAPGHHVAPSARGPLYAIVADYDHGPAEVVRAGLSKTDADAWLASEQRIRGGREYKDGCRYRAVRIAWRVAG